MKYFKTFESYSKPNNLVDEVYEVLGERVSKEELVQILASTIDEGLFSWIGGLFKNYSFKRKLDQLADQLTLTRIKLGTLQLEGDPIDRLKQELKDADKSDQYSSTTTYNQFDDDVDSPHQAQIDILQDQETEIVDLMDNIGQENDTLEKYVNRVKLESRLKSTEALMRVADSESKRILSQIRMKDQKNIKGIDKELEDDFRSNEGNKINEERPEWHDSDAPDANGKFKELNIEDLAAWLIKTRNKDLKKITGSLNQQIVFNRGEDKEYADKMEKVRKEVYRQLGREDLLERFNVNKYSPMSYAERVVNGSLSLEDAMQESGMPFTLLMSLIKKIDKNFKFTFEDRKWNDKRKGPHPYHATLSDKEEEEKKDQMKKQTKMSDSDPNAYKDMPGDKEAREEGKVKTSKHVKRYHELYGDKEQNESFINEEKEQSTDKGPIDSEAIETALKKKADETGVPIGIIRAVMRRGMAAWKTGHRPGATEQQWGYARVNSFLTKQSGTWGGADKDLAKEVGDIKESLVTEAEETYSDYPEAAKKNAQKAIDWKEEHGRDEVKGGTEVGWQRAHQLAKGEALSRDVVSRMAQFNRHRKNSKVAPEFKDEPWKDNGHIAWLIWGGDEGVDWAMAKMDKIKNKTNEMKHFKTFESFVNESHRVDKKDFDKVVDAVKKSGQSATVLLVTKWNSIDIIDGMDAPESISRAILKELDKLGLNRDVRDRITISGDSTSYSRREYDAIESINGGHRDY